MCHYANGHIEGSLWLCKHEMATTQWINQRIVNMQKNKIWTQYITHIKIQACRACQTKPGPKFCIVEKKKLIVVVEGGNGSAVNHQAQERDWNQKGEELKKKKRGQWWTGSEELAVAEWWTQLNWGGGHSRCCLTSAGGVPERGGGLGQSLVYNRVHVFGQVDRWHRASA